MTSSFKVSFTLSRAPMSSNLIFNSFGGITSDNKRFSNSLSVSISNIEVYKITKIDVSDFVIRCELAYVLLGLVWMIVVTLTPYQLLVEK